MRAISEFAKISDKQAALPFGESELPILIKKMAARDLKACQLSREQVALQLSARLGRRITLAQIDAITSETKAHRMPAEWIPAWVEITGSKAILDLVCRHCGLWVVTDLDRNLAELALAGLQQERLAEKVRTLKAQLAGQI